MSVNPMQPIPNVELPAAAVTQVWGFLGQRGSGKTYAALSLGESLMDSGAQWISVDPVGNHNGLRLSRDGKKASRFKLPVLGGMSGDVPLEPASGVAVADFLVDSGSSAVLDVSMMSGGEQAHFVTDLCERFFRRQQTVRRAVHVALEEAHLFAPQKAQRGRERMVGAVTKLIRLGRNYGIGASLISQRPQSIDKEVLNQADPLCVGRMPGTHERKAIADWLKYQGGADEMVAELHKLDAGDLWFWSPGWLQEFRRVRFAKRETFDSSATPTAGGAFGKVELKPIDLDSLRKSMATAVENAEANDPAKLRKRIAELEKAFAKHSPVPDGAAIARAVSKAITERDREWQGRVAELTKARDTLVGRIEKIASLAHVHGEATVKVEAPAIVHHRSHTTQSRPTSRLEPTAKQASVTGDSSLAAMPRAFLTALAQHGELPKGKVLIHAGYRSSGPASKCFAELVREGWAEGSAGRLRITDAGLAVLGPFNPLPTGAELRDLRLAELDTMPRAFLGAIFDAYPDPITKGEILAATRYTSSGPASKAFAMLAARDYAVKVGAGQLRAADVFFDD